MPTLFICFIVFIIWFRVKSKQNDKISTWDQDFWQKEHDANFARKKDISDLDYLIVQESDLPFTDPCDPEEAEYQSKIKSVISHPILNLSGMSNADIKLEYGLANFDHLSACDQNYLLLIRSLDQWGQYLYEAGDIIRSRQVLEYALNAGSDITKTYLTLGRIYCNKNETEKVQLLIERANASDSFMKENIIQQLTQIIREY